MKMKFLSILMLLSALLLGSCKKQEIKLTPLASIQITNAVVGGTALRFGTNAAIVDNNLYTTYGILTGSQLLRLSSTVAPNPVYYVDSKDFVGGGAYSLFLTGTPTAVESIFLKEKSILLHKDNLFGVRVINLKPVGVPISVNIKGNPSGSFVNNLAYKEISEFEEVSAKAEGGDKIFEFRNTENGDLITSFTIPGYDLPSFKNITLVFAGTAGSVFRINNY